jgi:hypothetical protein
LKIKKKLGCYALFVIEFLPLVVVMMMVVVMMVVVVMMMVVVVVVMASSKCIVAYNRCYRKQR